MELFRVKNNKAEPFPLIEIRYVVFQKRILNTTRKKTKNGTEAATCYS